MLKCMPEENIVAYNGVNLTGNLLKSVGFTANVPLLPSDADPALTVRLNEISSANPQRVERLILSGNAAIIRIEFFDNGDFILDQKYDRVDAAKPIIFDPPRETLYLRIIFIEAVPLESGALPLNYHVTFSLTGCFSFICGTYIETLTLIYLRGISMLRWCLFSGPILI